MADGNDGLKGGVPDERVTIGLSRPLSGVWALSIASVAAALGVFVPGALGGVVSNLGSGHFAAVGVAGACTLVFGALLARFLNDFLPQRAWSEGSVLGVARGRRLRHCDLATAETIKLGRTVPLATRGYSQIVPVLRARQHKGSPLVRLALRGDDLQIMPANQLLLLTGAIESGPAGAMHAAKVCKRLRYLADKQTPLSPLGWSFRTDPQGRRHADQ